MSKFNTPKNIIKYYQMCTKYKVHIFIDSSVLFLIMQNLNIKECKLMELQITQTRHHLTILDGKHPPKNETIFIKIAQFRCVNSHYTKCEHKGMEIVGATDYTNQTPSKHFGWKKCLRSSPSKMRIYS